MRVICVCRLQIHQDLREELAKVKTLEGLAGVSKQLKLRCQVTAVLMMHDWGSQNIESDVLSAQDHLREADKTFDCLRCFYKSVLCSSETLLRSTTLVNQ